jgi:hypothetical protein
MKRTAGFAPIVVILMCSVIGGAALVPNWRPWNWSVFQPKVPVAALTQAQAEFAKAQKEAAAREADLLAAQAKERAGLVDQVGYAHQMAHGASIALKSAPQSPEVTLASGLLERVDSSLTAAIGDLPAERQAEIRAIVEGALSAKQAEVDAAKAKLAARDADLARVTTEREQVKAQIPVLENSLATAQAKVVATQADVTVKTQEVVTFAQKVAEKEKEAGSLTAQIGSLIRIALFVGLVYLVIHFVLPSLAQEYPSANWLTNLNRITKSVTSAHT